MNLDSKILITGGTGLVGTNLKKYLNMIGYTNVWCPTRNELNLLERDSVFNWFYKNKPEYVFHCAAHVGGITYNNSHPVEFLSNNIQIQTNVIDAAAKHDTYKLMFLGSSCIYPRNVNIPIGEDQLLTGSPEPTNEAYALAKICGVKLCQYYNKQYGKNFISIMPCNLYGPHDNFSVETCHVIPAIIHKFHEAKRNNLNEVDIWGTGTPLREFLYIDDLVEIMVFLMNHYNDSEIINVGSPKEYSIGFLYEHIRYIMDYNCETKFDLSKPDGLYSKKLYCKKLYDLFEKYSFDMKYTSITEGLEQTIKYYYDTHERN